MPNIKVIDPDGNVFRVANATVTYLEGDNNESIPFYYCQNSKPITPSTSSQIISPDAGYKGMRQVSVGAVTSSIDSNIQSGNIKSGVTILGVSGSQYVIDTFTQNGASSGDILASKTAFVNGSTVVGTMSDNGSATWALSDTTPVVTSAGYYSAGQVSIDVPNIAGLQSSNIKYGTTILGIAGTYRGTWATGAPVTVTPYVISQTIMPSDEDVDCFTQVNVDAVAYVETDNLSGGKTVSIGGSIYTIRAGTYIPRNIPSSYQYKTMDITIDYSYVVSGTTYYGSKLTVIDASKDPVLSINVWLLGYWVGGDPTYGDPYPFYVIASSALSPQVGTPYWRWSGETIPLTISNSTIVTPEQYSTFNMYFQRQS